MNPTPSHHPTYRELRNELSGTPESVAVFFDDELACLLQHGIQDTHLSAYLLGEALLRVWLYAGSQAGDDILQNAKNHLSDSLLAYFEAQILPYAKAIKREGFVRHTLDPDRIGLDGHDARIWQFLFERIQAYCCADGLIPVINPANPTEALLLPFKVFPGAIQPGEVLDTSGRIIGDWAKRIQAVQHLLDYLPRIVLCCHCGQRADLLNGNSMILPICMAMARRNGALHDFAQWDVVATGALTTDGALERVSGLPGKASIAQRAGARLFICPDTQPNDGLDTLTIPPQTSLADCIRLIDEALGDRGLSKLDTRQALTKLKELKTAIHEGLLGLEKAETRLARYEAILKQANPPDEYSLEGRAVALIIRGSIANHAGDPDAAKTFLAEAFEWIEHHKLDPMLYCDAVANNVVSLTDLGLLDEAEGEGYRLLLWVDNLCADPPTKLRARMTARGALGGQPLLQKALLSPDTAQESLTLLTAAYDFAVKLGNEKEQARDAVQIALWHALLKPETASAEISMAEQRLDELHTQGQTSQPYLQSYRFLAAYRLFLTRNRLIPDFESWPIPESCANWITAVSLKYRGTLHACAGHIPQAEQDFQQAFATLDSTTKPLLRFIGATTALQAAHSLRKARPESSRAYATQALERFAALQSVLHGIHRDSNWLASARALLDNTPPIESPQKYYRY